MPSSKQLDDLIQLYESGKFPEAEAHCRAMLKAGSESFALHNLLGLILQGLGRLPEAVAAHDVAIGLSPGNAKAYTNRGTALMRLGQTAKALRDFDEAIRLQPNLAGAHLNRGMLLRGMGQLTAAGKSYKQAITLQPNLAVAYSNYGNVLLEMGSIEAAITNYSKAIELDPAYTQAHSNLLMAANYLPEQDREQAMASAEKFAEAARANITGISHPKPATGPGKLRVGFVSGDLRDHPVGYLLEELLAALGKSKLELIAFSCTPETDALTRRIRPHFQEWLTLFDKTDADTARLINEKQIDILIDLAGHTANNRLPIFVHKPAPVQLSWPGYFATTGLPEIDYVITDPHLSPPGSEAWFKEKLWRLPETRWCFSRPHVDCEVSKLPALVNGYITFASQHTLAKLNSRVIDLWARLLKALPGSKLLIRNGQMRDPQLREALFALFKEKSVENDRLQLAEPLDRQRYFESYRSVDIALDPFPFSGGVTNLDSLWMGVPFVTLAGNSMASRQGVSMLENIGLQDLIAHSEEEYLEKVIELASDLENLAVLRMRLRENLIASPLMDAEKFAVEFEDALFQLWNSWKG